MTSVGPSANPASNPDHKPDAAAHLPLVRDMIASRFADELAAACVETADALFDRANASRDDSRQKLLMDASVLLRNNRAELTKRAAAALVKRFDQKLDSDANSLHSKTAAFSLSSLALQDDFEVQENIALNESVKRLKDAASFEFRSLTMRMQSLTGRSSLPDSENPIFPRVFCRALLEGIVQVDAKDAIKLTIFVGFQPALEKSLPKIYNAVNKALIEQGILPDIVESYGKPVVRGTWRPNGGGGTGTPGGTQSYAATGPTTGTGQTREVNRPYPGQMDNSPVATGVGGTPYSASGIGNGGGSYAPLGHDHQQHSPPSTGNREVASSTDIAGLLNQLISLQRPNASTSVVAPAATSTSTPAATSVDAGFAELHAQLTADLGANTAPRASAEEAVAESPLDQSKRTFIGSVAFIDIVGFSKVSVSEQTKLKDRFNAFLGESTRDVSADQRFILDTGDGAALSFLGDPEDALFVCMKMRNLIRQETASLKPGQRKLELRQGINLGPVKLTRDINGQPNILGDGINVAQRIMSFADLDQVAVSRSYFDVVSVMADEYAPLFTRAGMRADKHVREHEIYMVGESAAAYELIRDHVAERYASSSKGGATSGRHAEVGASMVNASLLDALNRLQSSVSTLPLGGQPLAPGNSQGGSAGMTRTAAESGGFPALFPEMTGTPSSASPTDTKNTDGSNVLYQVQEILSPQMTPAHIAVTDLLASIFDRIFDDAGLSASVKALLGRLQIPALKVAVLDTGVFTDAQHPLRVLIDRIALLGIQRGASLTEDDAFYKQLASIVETVQADYAAKLDVLGDALKKLDAVVAAEEAQTEAEQATTRRELEQNEQNEAAHDAVARKIASLTNLYTYPDAIYVFVTLDWRTVLIHDYRAGGEAGEHWQSSIATMDALLWSVTPEIALAERPQLMKLIAELPKRLNDGLDRAGVPETDRALFFKQLTTLHSIASRPPTRLPPQSPQITPAAEPPVLMPAVIAEPPAPTQPRLPQGQWIQLLLGEDTWHSCRLSWVSPRQETYIFKNYHTQSTLTITVDALDEKLKSGTARLVEGESLMQRSIDAAVTGLLEKNS